MQQAFDGPENDFLVDRKPFAVHEIEFLVTRSPLRRQEIEFLVIRTALHSPEIHFLVTQKSLHEHENDFLVMPIEDVYKSARVILSREFHPLRIWHRMPNMRTNCIMKPVTDYTDSEYLAWYTAFCDTAVARAAELGLTPEELAELNAARDEVDARLLAAMQAKLAARAAVTEKNEARAAAHRLASLFSKRFNAMNSVPDSALVALGLPPRGGRPGNPLRPPTELVVTTDGSGINKLRWNRNGNIRTVFFTVERFDDPDTGWQILGFCERPRYHDDTSAAGRPAGYRVITNRNGEQSSPSNEAIVYASNLPAQAA